MEFNNQPSRTLLVILSLFLGCYSGKTIRCVWIFDLLFSYFLFLSSDFFSYFSIDFVTVL